MFESVAGRYDLMNDLMSLGAHRLWKRFALARTGLRPGGVALDVAGGTGDLALGMSRQVGPQGRVLLSDINPAMLRIGRRRLLDTGFWSNSRAVCADATALPFAEGLFDCVTIGFGLRNVTGKPAALKSMARAVKSGGRLLVLEFSRPAPPVHSARLRLVLVHRHSRAGPGGCGRRRQLSLPRGNRFACIRTRNPWPI